VDVSHDIQGIFAAIMKQVEHGKYPSNHLYGDGNAGVKIADILATANISNIQKKITY
jgi:hypothetical protein